jgi:ribosomal protein S18 acetylase RimI-like enzyme
MADRPRAAARSARAATACADRVDRTDSRFTNLDRSQVSTRKQTAISANAPPGIIIRPATRADLPRLGRLGALLVAAHHAYDPQRFLAARNWTPVDYGSYLVSQLDDPDVVILVADDNGDMIGYTYATIEGYDYMALRGPAGVLQDIVVDPESRRRGVGRLLLEATLAALQARGAPRAVLSTAAKNEDAQRLFASMGFRRTMIEMTRELDDTAR